MAVRVNETIGVGTSLEQHIDDFVVSASEGRGEWCQGSVEAVDLVRERDIWRWPACASRMAACKWSVEQLKPC